MADKAWTIATVVCIERFMEVWLVGRNFITKIRINNVRHLNNIEIPLSEDKLRHLILTGKNGSGKTSVLEALRLYLVAKLEDDYVVSRVREKLRDNPLKEQFEADVSASTQFFLEYGDTRKTITDCSGVDVSFSNDINGKVSEKFLFAYYQAEREYSVKNEKGVEKVNFKNHYGAYEFPGENFVKYIKQLKSQSALYWQENNQTRSEEILSRLDNFANILRRIYGNEQLELCLNVEDMVIQIKHPGKLPFAFDGLSSGYAAVLYIVIDLMMRMEKSAGGRYDMEGVVLIDEVDAHLHLSMQKNILPLLTWMFPNIQFIVTTHSPFVLNSVSDAVVYDLGNNQRIDTAEGLSNLPYSGIVEGYFGASELSDKLKRKFERYKELSRQSSFSADDYEELGDLESYLDEIPDFLALNIVADYQQIKSELEQREGAKDTHGEM